MTPNAARFNQARALLIRIQSMADSAQHSLLSGDDRQARRFLEQIQDHLDAVRIDLAPPATPTPPTVPGQAQLATT
jgi:hypothetical protein